MFHKKASYVLGLSLVTGFACSSKKDDDKTGGVLKASFEPSRIASGDLKRASLALSPNATLADNALGQTEGTDLEALSYRVQSISLCGQLQTQGSGTNCVSGAWELYGAERGDYDAYLPEQAEADTTNFTNFINNDDVKKLGTDISYSDGNVQSYDSVLVYWYRPFKVKASVTLMDGTKLYTKANGTYVSNNKPGLDVTYENHVSNITTGPAEEAVFFLPNGGTYFRLQKKFEITEDDVKNKTNFKVVFAFDPDGIIKGEAYDGIGDPNGWYEGMADPTLKYRIKAPFLQIAPVVARESETIMREIYLLRSKSTEAPHDVRLSLYYVKEDADQAIRAVTTTTVYNKASQIPVGNFPQIDSVELVDGKLNFKDWAGISVVKGLVRSSTPGELSGEITKEICNGETSNAGCQGTITTEAYSYALIAASEVKAEITAGYIPPPPETEETEGGE